MTPTAQELDDLRAKMEPQTSLKEMNTLADEIASLRDEEKKLSDLKKTVTEQLEARENRVLELLMEHNLTSYKAPAGGMSLSFRTSVRQPQGEQVPLWIQTLIKEYGSLEGAIQAGMLTTNSQKLNSFYKEQLELSQERGEDHFSIQGLTEVKTLPILSFRRAR